MIAKGAVNYVLRYWVSDTESIRKVHLFMWAEPYDGARESRRDYFGPQDLPVAVARARISQFLEAAREQAASTDFTVAAAAAGAAERLASLLDCSKVDGPKAAAFAPPPGLGNPRLASATTTECSR